MSEEEWGVGLFGERSQGEISVGFRLDMKKIWRATE